MDKLPLVLFFYKKLDREEYWTTTPAFTYKEMDILKVKLIGSKVYENN